MDIFRFFLCVIFYEWIFSLSFLFLLINLDKFNLFLIWSSVDLGIDFSLIEKLFITFHEKSPGFFIQSTFREGHNQETSYCLKYSLKTPVLGIPIFFQSIDTNFSRRLRYIWMKYFCQKVTFRRFLWEFVIKNKLTSENTSLKWRFRY